MKSFKLCVIFSLLATTMLFACSGCGNNQSANISIEIDFYYCGSDGANGYELWKSDGTESGTVMVKDINAGVNSSNSEFLANVNGMLFFAANDGPNGRELWKSDGTGAGTVMIKDSCEGGCDGVPD